MEHGMRVSKDAHMAREKEIASQMEKDTET